GRRGRDACPLFWFVHREFLELGVVTGNINDIRVVRTVRDGSGASDIFRAPKCRAGRMQFAAKSIPSAVLSMIRFGMRIGSRANILEFTLRDRRFVSRLGTRR